MECRYDCLAFVQWQSLLIQVFLYRLQVFFELFFCDLHLIILCCYGHVVCIYKFPRICWRYVCYVQGESTDPSGRPLFRVLVRLSFPARVTVNFRLEIISFRSLYMVLHCITSWNLVSNPVRHTVS